MSDLHLTLDLRIARCQTLSLSTCSWRCHKTSRYVFSSLSFICFCNHSSRSQMERDQFVFGCFNRSTTWEFRSLSTWEFYHDLTHRRFRGAVDFAIKQVGKYFKMLSERIWWIINGDIVQVFVQYKTFLLKAVKLCLLLLINVLISADG